MIQEVYGRTTKSAINQGHRFLRKDLLYLSPFPHPPLTPSHVQLGFVPPAHQTAVSNVISSLLFRKANGHLFQRSF